MKKVYEFVSNYWGWSIPLGIALAMGVGINNSQVNRDAAKKFENALMTAARNYDIPPYAFDVVCVDNTLHAEMQVRLRQLKYKIVPLLFPLEDKCTSAYKSSSTLLSVRYNAKLLPEVTVNDFEADEAELKVLVSSSKFSEVFNRNLNNQIWVAQQKLLHKPAVLPKAKPPVKVSSLSVNAVPPKSGADVLNHNISGN